MRELKHCEFKSTIKSEVENDLNDALNRVNYDSLFMVVEPFQRNSFWYAGLCYWQPQRHLKAV